MEDNNLEKLDNDKWLSELYIQISIIIYWYIQMTLKITIADAMLQHNTEMSPALMVIIDPFIEAVCDPSHWRFWVQDKSIVRQ